MRICFLNHDLDDRKGAGRFGVNFISRLRQARPDIQCTVLTSAGSGHPLEEAILYPSKVKFLLALPRIRAVFRHCDLIHALDGWPYGVIAALASLGLGKKLVITAIGTGAVQPLYRPYGWLVAWAYRRASRVVAISSNTRREILARVPDVAITVINHAVDAGEFSGDLSIALTAEERSAIRALKPYVLSVGGWKRRKGFQYSFAAFAEMKKRFPELSYVICGIGPKPQLEEPLGLGGAVSYFKNIRWPFLKAIYAGAELFFLLPVDDSKDIEGFGFAFLEAAAAGLPVIGTRDSGAEDALSDGVNGFLVPPRDADAAAEAAIRILSDAQLRERFRAASLAFAREMTWERVTSSYQRLYAEII
ncbi:MAG: glycosyltransferase family 4 protein [Candidatus Sungbacteria bacterium]|uniref:Glycosyltransferase family 4 protein n=1 Tax=Candidatus Sungiibacteriota bacterium TaxID=2750080 RepID=A0A932YY59_9BACT|nr:glycosyltransferase family 4 protein [Candidatus Sungbacteria bacterium]